MAKPTTQRKERRQMEQLQALAHGWRAESATHERRGSAQVAAVLKQVADELSDALRGRDDETLTLTQAAALCGYTAGHLGKLVRAGKLPNHGRLNAPLVRRRDLPVKAGGQAVGPGTLQFESAPRERIARSIVTHN